MASMCPLGQTEFFTCKDTKLKSGQKIQMAPIGILRILNFAVGQSIEFRQQWLFLVRLVKTTVREHK